MKILTKTLVAGALLSALPLAHAEGPHEFSANIAVTTDYVFRGVSQSNEDAALSGGFDYGHESGFYAGFWASSIEFNAGTSDTASAELDYYAGYGNDLGDTGISYDVSALYYAYPSQNEDVGTGDYDYWEFILGLGYSISDMVGVGFTYAYSPDFFGEIGDGHYFGGNVDLALAAGFGASIALGRQNFSDVDGDYTHWSAGVSKEVGNFGFDLTYHDTNIDDLAIADSRVVFTVSSSW